MKTLSSKKICVVMSQFPDSTSPRFLAQLDVLQQMGYLLRIICLKDFSEEQTLSEYSRIEGQSICLNLAKYQIPQALLTLLLLVIIAPLKSLKAFWIMLKMLFQFSDRKQVIKNYLQAGILVNQHIIDKEISHLHGHCSPDAVRTVYLSSILTGLNSSYLTLPGEIFEPEFELLKPALVNSTFIFTLSEYEKNILMEKTFNDVEELPAMFCFLNGIDLEKFRFVRSLAQLEEPYQLLTTAHLTRKKGLDIVLCALNELKRDGMRFKYKIVGDGPERKELEKLARDLGIDDRVEFLGIMPRYEIPKILAETDLYVLASRILENGEQDSLPLGIKEAMAAGVPVVATDCGATRELIETEETGLLVPADDILVFAAACSRMLTNDELRNQVILKARLQIEGVYDIHKQAQNFNKYLAKHDIPL